MSPHVVCCIYVAGGSTSVPTRHLSSLSLASGQTTPPPHHPSRVMQYHQTPSYFIALHQQKTRQQPEEGDGSAGSSRAGEGAHRLASEPAEQCGARYRSGRQQQQTVVEGRSATVGQLSREVAGQLAHEQDRLSTGQLTRGLNRQTVRQLPREFDRESAGQLTRGLGSVTAGQLTHEVTRAPCVASSEPARPPAVGQ